MPPVLVSRGTQASMIDLAGIRHPLLLQPCLPDLPDPLIQDDTLMTASTGTCISNQHGHGNQVEQRESETAPASWPEPLDLTVPEGVQVVALTGANTGGKTSCLKALVRPHHTSVSSCL